jgi:hypothetical protein
VDLLTASLCMSIGTAVAWLIALYTEDGAHRLFWNTFFGMLGAFLCALAILRFAPVLGVVGLVMAGPIAAWLAIIGGNALRRMIGKGLGLIVTA